MKTPVQIITQQRPYLPDAGITAVNVEIVVNPDQGKSPGTKAIKLIDTANGPDKQLAAHLRR